MPFVIHRFNLIEKSKDVIRAMTPKFGGDGFGELVFYRTYSRIICKKCRKGVRDDFCSNCPGSLELAQESWADVVIRVIEGTFSIRKDWYLKAHIAWNESYWQDSAKKMAISMFKMEWMPPGRGMWAMGSDFVYERGSMALYNCAFCLISTANMAADYEWLMDSLMHGVGVGLTPERDNDLTLKTPGPKYDHIIPDSREGWVESEGSLIRAYLYGEGMPNFIYDQVRGPGLPIRGFGGISSGPKPLKDLHERTIMEFEKYKTRPEYDSVYLKANLANHVGCCVVAGNVRRSAEIMLGGVNDQTFVNLKDYKRFPERESFGWLSNNSVILETDQDFQSIGEIAKRVIQNGEPGYINRQTMPYGRLGKKMKGLRKDPGIGLNPCGEIILCDRELCNICETLPTVCEDLEIWKYACEYATTYCCSVSLLPTHQESSNRIVAKNRRIGVSIIDYSGWKLEHGVHKVTQYLRDGYDVVRACAATLNDEAGVPRPIRHTTIKPGGTTPKLPGKTSGIGHPTFAETLRRIRVAKNSPIHPLLVEAGIPNEEDVFDPYTDCFEFPILQGPACPASEVSIWEQALNLVLVQREWSDNAVSNTLYFRPMWPLIEHITEDFEERLEYYFGIGAVAWIMSRDQYKVPDRYLAKIKRFAGDVVAVDIHEYDPGHEEDCVEPVLAAIAPSTKSVSVLPHSAKGAYRQMPEEGLTREDYKKRLLAIKPIDWSKLIGSDGQDELYCSGPNCEIPKP